MHGGRHGARVEGVTDAKGGLEGTVGDAGFGFFGYKVEDSGAGGFGAGACGGGDCDQREERLGNGEAFAKGCIDKVEEFGGREAGVEVHEFSSIDDLQLSVESRALARDASVHCRRQRPERHLVRRISKIQLLP